MDRLAAWWRRHRKTIAVAAVAVVAATAVAAVWWGEHRSDAFLKVILTESIAIVVGLCVDLAVGNSTE